MAGYQGPEDAETYLGRRYLSSVELQGSLLPRIRTTVHGVHGSGDLVAARRNASQREKSSLLDSSNLLQVSN